MAYSAVYFVIEIIGVFDKNYSLGHDKYSELIQTFFYTDRLSLPLTQPACLQGPICVLSFFAG